MNENTETIAGKSVSTAHNSQTRGRFLINVSSNIFITLAQTIANLWLTPFLILHLGLAVFGVIPLVTTLTSYMSIFTTALDSAVSRYLALDLGHNDKCLANKTFNTALFGLLAIITILLPLAAMIALVFPLLFDVPPGWGADSSWLFFIAALAFFATVIGGCFSLSPYIRSNFLAINFVNLAGLVVRIGITFFLITTFSPRLWFAGSGLLAGAFVSLVGFIFLWKRTTPELHVQTSAFDRTRLRDLAGMGGWVVVNMTGAALLGRVDLIIVNIWFGATVMGGYASVTQFPLLMEYLVSAVGNVMRPVILMKFAQEDFHGLEILASQSVKLLGFALALPVGLICGFAQPLIKIWLGLPFVYLSPLLVILVIHLALNLSIRPLLHVQNAYNKVRWPGIITLLSGIANLLLAIAFAVWGKWGYFGVALAGGLVWTIKNAIYMPIYTASIMKLPAYTFLPSLGGSIFGTLFVTFISYMWTENYEPANWLTLGMAAVVVSLVYAASIWIVGLNHAERTLITSLAFSRKFQ